MAFTTQYVPVLDGGVPRTITGVAREAISGGQFVYCSGAAAKVNVSGLDSFAASDIEFATGASGTLFTGIATHNAASGAYVTVATAGMFIVGGEATTTAGQVLSTGGVHGVRDLTGSGVQMVARALTSAGSEGYAVVKLL